MADSTTNVRQILSADPYSIKKSLVTLFSNKFGLTDGGTLEADFAGYLIQALTLLGSDTMSNLAFSWNEAFTHRAKLRSSVNDLATMFDYNIIKATPCSGTMTVQIEFPLSASTTYTTTIRDGSICSQSGSPQYLVNGTYDISLGSNTYVKKKDSASGVITEVAYNIVVKDSTKYLSFQINVTQMKIFEHSFTFSNVNYGDFTDINISGYEDSIYSINVGVYITQDDTASKYTQLIKFSQVDNIYSATPSDKVYAFIPGKNNTATIRFGNGIFGYQPEDGQEGKIILYTTMGLDGAVNIGGLSLSGNYTDSISNISLNVSSSNLNAINNGTNEEELEIMKKHIIDQISSARRFVTQNDYNSYEGITGMNNITAWPLLLRRDTNTNEIDLFAVLFDDDGKPMPTTSPSIIVDKNIKTFISKDLTYSIYYTKDSNYKYMQSVKNIPTYGLVNGNEYYIDDTFDTNDESNVWYNHAGQLATYHNPAISVVGKNTPQSWTFSNIDSNNKKSFVCPYNILIDGDVYKRALYEYIPSKLTLSSTLQDQTSNAGINIAFNNTLINLLPEQSLEYINIDVTHYNMIHKLTYAASMMYSDITCFTTITSNETIPSINKTYEFKILSNNSYDGMMELSYNIPVGDLPYIDWETTSDEENNPNILTISTVVKYKNDIYNTYNRKIILRINDANQAINAVRLSNVSQDYINTELSYNYKQDDIMSMPSNRPNIENISFGISTILFNWTSWSSGSNDIDGYEMLIYLYKLSSIDATNISCELTLAGTSYSPYTYGVGGNGTVLVYRIRIPYNVDAAPTGSLTFKILFSYKYSQSNTPAHFSTYTGTVIARQVLSNTMWSTVLNATDPNTNESKYKIYRVPMIEKTYYENNKDLIEEKILYTFGETDYNFNTYKMLTDSVNVKYATTMGLTKNLQYNTSSYDNETVNSRFIYNNWAWDIAPTITAEIIIASNINKTSAEIISECRDVIFSFVTMKSTGFNKSIIKSDIIRYIHDTIPEIISCTITEPTRDIIYVYKEINLPRNKDLLLSYVPEFMWIDKDKINVDIISYPE